MPFSCHWGAVGCYPAVRWLRRNIRRAASCTVSTQHLGQETFPIIQRYVDDILTASDAELIDCMAFMATRMKLVVEPTGCLGFAGARQMKAELNGKRIGVLVSGGNIDMARFASLLSS